MSEEEIMKINLDHFKSIEELKECLEVWIKDEDVFSFDRYLNQEDVLTIVQLLIKKENIIKEVREYKEQLLFDLNRGKCFEKWEEILNPIDEILDKVDKEVN